LQRSRGVNVRRVRRLVALVVGAAVIAAVALGGASAPAACIATVRLHAISYVGTEFERLPARRGVVRGGVVPGCNDTIPAAPEPDRPIALRALKGVPSRVAVARPGSSPDAYLAPGFLLGLRAHPLHADARPQRPSALFGCSSRSVLRGRLRSQPGAGAGFVLVAGGRRIDVAVRASTRMRTTRVAGVPYLAGHERLEVRGCRSASGRAIAAFSIRRLAPMS
jgi:hypothetical protein